ncbi:MAG: hypothetical protein JWO33_506 [Caulobacteraceae bacterium]|nr:hypothetical protein [Caulobacteraceae bacterium]
MPSTVVRTFAYAPNEQRLDIVFTSGRAYSYHEVPPETFEAMKATFAKGVFFNRHIRDQFRCTPKVKPAGPLED